MTNTLGSRSFKPTLERLETRDLPSFLLSGALNQVVQPLDNINKDLTSAASALQNAANLLTADKTNGATAAKVAQDFSAGVASYQRALNDQHTIAAGSAAIQAFVNTAALAEFQNGDSVDLFIIAFGNFFNFRPLQPLQDAVTTANGTINSLQSVVNQTYTGLGSASISLPSIASQVQTPDF